MTEDDEARNAREALQAFQLAAEDALRVNVPVAALYGAIYEAYSDWQREGIADAAVTTAREIFGPLVAEEVRQAQARKGLRVVKLSDEKPEPGSDTYNVGE